MIAPFAQVIQEAADQLGLEVRNGQAAFELSASTKLFTAADKLGRDAAKNVDEYQEVLAGSRALLTSLSSLLPIEGLMNNYQAAMGKLDDDTVFLVPEIRQNVPTLHIALMFGTPQNLKLYLFPQEWYHSIGAVFGLADIQVGDSNLDPLAIIRAKDPEEAKILLSKPEVVKALTKLFSDRVLEPVVNDLSVRSLVTRVPKAEEIVEWVKTMQEVSRALAG